MAPRVRSGGPRAGRVPAPDGAAGGAGEREGVVVSRGAERGNQRGAGGPPPRRARVAGRGGAAGVVSNESRGSDRRGGGAGRARRVARGAAGGRRAAGLGADDAAGSGGHGRDAGVVGTRTVSRGIERAAEEDGVIMSDEGNLNAAERELEAALGALRPSPAAVDRDSLMFEAGRRSVGGRRPLAWQVLSGA